MAKAMMLAVRRFLGTVRLVKAGKEMQLRKLDTAELKLNLKLEEAKREVAEAKLGAVEEHPLLHFKETLFGLWWNGPSWLQEQLQNWPTWKEPEITPDIIRKVESEITHKGKVMFETSLSVVEFNPRPFSIDSTKYSKLRKLLVVTRLCLQFIAKCRKAFSSDTDATTYLNEATRLWVKNIQTKHYPRNSNNNLTKQLGLKEDECGIIRCHGRLSNAEIPYDAKYPTLLPANEHFTKLLILDCHQRLLHAGVSHTLAQVRHSYRIPHGRATVKKILHTCTTCRRFETGPYAMPRFPPIPKERVSQSLPFTFTGLDYLGPLIARSPNGTFPKVWTCLFTCMATRAITLEVITDMSSEQFLLCLRRFISARGRPARVISDNAPQFKLVHATCDGMDMSV
eukprot:scpid90833/ scgid22836/ 